MGSRTRFNRLLLLGLSLLSGCAAGGVGTDAALSQSNSGYGAYLMGRFAEQNNEMDTAATDLLRALDQNEADPTLLSQAFQACMEANRPEAVTLARRLPNDPIAQLLLGDVAAQHGNWQQSQAIFTAVKAAGVAQYLAPLLIAWTEQGAHDTDAALATLQPSLARPPLAAMNDLHAALIADLGDRYPQAQALYGQAQSGYGGLNLRLARILSNWDLRQGRPDDATDLLKSLGRTAPGLAMLVPGLTADLHSRPVANATDGIAEVYLSFAAELGDHATQDTGLTLLRLALDLRPDLTAARLLMADILASKKHPRAALLTLGSVAATDPLNPLVVLRRAELQQTLGDTATAEAELRQLAASLPGQPEPLAALGDLQRTQKHYETAIATYGQAIALAGTQTPSNWTLFFARAISEQALGHWPSAEADLHHALSLSPDQPEVLNFLGFSWADRNEHLAEARAMLTRAVQLRPHDGEIIDSLGWVELRQGDVTDALHALETAVQLDPEDPEINGHLGDAYWAAGRKLQARYQWQLALNFKPEPDQVPKLEAKLQSAERATEARGGPQTP